MAKMKDRKSRKNENDYCEEPEETEERYDKAFFVTLGLIALLSLLIFIPGIGFILVLTLAPFIAGYFGSKYVTKKDGIQIGVIIGIIWTAIELFIIFQIAKSMNMSLIEPGIYSAFDAFIIFLVFCLTAIFCGIGGWVGGREVSEI